MAVKWNKLSDKLPDEKCGRVFVVLQRNPVWEDADNDWQTKWFVDVGEFDSESKTFYKYTTAGDKSTDIVDAEYWIALPESPEKESTYDYEDSATFFGDWVDELRKEIGELREMLEVSNRRRQFRLV